MFSYVTIIEVYKSFSIVCPNLLNKKRKFSQSLLLFQQLLEYEKNDMRLFLSLPLISQNYKPLLTIVVVTSATFRFQKLHLDFWEIVLCCRRDCCCCGGFRSGCWGCLGSSRCLLGCGSRAGLLELE